MSGTHQVLLMASGGGGGGSAEDLLLHMDGTDGSTTFTDSGANGYTITAHGDAQIDTAQSKFGGASGLFDGTGDRLSTTMASWNPGTDVFTIDVWYRMTTTSPGDHFPLWTVGSGALWLTRLSNRMYFGSGGGVIFSPVCDTTANVWHHAAITHTGGGTPNWFLFQSGTQLGNNADVVSPGAQTAFNVAYWPAENMYFNGHMDELRIRLGEAVWTAGFTPPSSPYT